MLPHKIHLHKFACYGRYINKGVQMRALVFLIALVSFPASAQDCEAESEEFFNLVAAKWAVNDGIENDPKSFDGEKWLYIWGGAGLALEEKNVSEKRAQRMARLVAENDFSTNPEVEVNIFEDYWYLSCELEKKGHEVVPLVEIKKRSLIECWNTVASREEFQGCLTPLIKKS